MTPFERSIREVLERLEPRAVGNLLRGSSGLPWWRVVTADGRLVPGSEREHERRLGKEGILVRDGRVAGRRARPATIER